MKGDTVKLIPISKVSVFCVVTLFFLTCVSAARAAGNTVNVDPALQTLINEDETTGYIIHFRAKPSLTRARTMEWEGRGRFVANTLRDAAETSQADVKAFLTGKNIEHKSFWIGNMIVVEKSDLATLNSLKEFAEIDRIRKRPKIILYEPVERTAAGARIMAIESNLTHIKADQAWALGAKGSGIVVSNIDTGVRYTHHALVNQYRGNSGGGAFNHNYNWWDPTNHSAAPIDNNGHGSHTMGIMVGNDGDVNQTGVAPEAKWIACAGCPGGACSDMALLECAQWIAAPWDLSKSNPNPDLRPHVVNNSWGDCAMTYDGWFRDVIDNWQAAGIYPVFSNGNSPNCGYSSPPVCGTVGNPGRYGNVTGVGATGTSDGQYATFSLWGRTDNPDTVNPAGYPYLKPQVSAPGTNIRSSYNSSDSSYAVMSGTSMSAPHVTGLVALMYSACPGIARRYGAVETMIQNAAVPIPYATACGGEGPGNVPNNATGWGEIDANAAVRAAFAACNAGTVTGKVLNAQTRKPIENATVTVGGYSMMTDAAGTFTAPFIEAGQQTVTASLYGYYDQSIRATIVKDFTITVNFRLKAKPLVQLTGNVKDASGAPWPLYASLTATSGNETEAAVSDALTGAYTMKLYKDTDYELQASSYGYTAKDITVTTTGQFGPKNFALTVDPGCVAPGYESGWGNCVARSGGLVTGLVLDANTGSPLAGITVDSPTGRATSDSSGRYVVFSPAGGHSVVANESALLNYGAVYNRVIAKSGKVVKSDFKLPAASFKGPKSVSVSLPQDSTATVTLKLQNTGGLPTPFTLSDYPAATGAAATRVSLPPSDYTPSLEAQAASTTGRAPQTVRDSSRSSAAGIFALAGYPAFAVDLDEAWLVSFNSDAPGVWTAIGPTPAVYGSAFLNGDFSKLYAVSATNKLYTVDTATAVATTVGAAVPYRSESWTGLTASVTGTLYGASTDCSRSTLYTMDPATGAASMIGKITGAPCIIDIAMNVAGDMYGVDIAKDMLVKINPATGEGTLIGSIGFNANHAQGLSFEPTSGVLYYAAFNNDTFEGRGELRMVDIATGNTTLVGPFPDGALTDALAFATSVDAAWLSQTPATGSVESKKTRSIKVKFDATGMSPGTYNARIKVLGETPYSTFLIPVTMTVTPKKSGAR